MQPIQPAVSVSVPARISFVMLAIALLGVVAPRFVAAPAIAPPTTPLASLISIVIRSFPPPAIDRLDDEWRHADHLARVIEARRYGEIQAAADAIAPTSRYAAWVPAALALAVDQLDATADAYARMGMCRELGRFQHRTTANWPQGRAAMQHVYCEGHWVCGTGRHEAIKAAGSIEAYRRQLKLDNERRHAELVEELTTAHRARDHVSALYACGEIGAYGAIPATCLIEACRANDLAVAEVLFTYLEVTHEDQTRDPRLWCSRDGIDFTGAGIARLAVPAPWAAPQRQPVDLVRVHPDAPPANDGVIIDW